VKKLVIAVLVVGALPAVALPPHVKIGDVLKPKYHASEAFRGSMQRATDATAMPRASTERAARANEAPKAQQATNEAR
jgi:hypothetical protein